MLVLPDELTIHVLSLCDPVSLVTCRAVCKSLCILINESTRLQYYIELYADGMVETHTTCPLSLAERLSSLRSRRTAWMELKWDHRPTAMIPGSWSAYELVDGIFSRTLDLSGNNSKSIFFAVLPSKDSPGSITKVDDFGVLFRDFAMDPTQDLIVLMQYTRLVAQTIVTLHFRTMSDQKPHPRASQPFVRAVLDTANITGAVIQTVGDVVGFMTWDNNSSQLWIWDWTLCTLLVAESQLHRLGDFAFVSDEAYVLTSSVPEPCLRVYTFPSDNSANALPSRPTLRATLRLPDMQVDLNASQLGVHTGPFTTASQNSSSFGPGKPFVHNSRSRIHVISLELLGPLDLIDASTSCLAIVHNNTFLSYARSRKGEEDEEEDQTPADLDWFEWGPDQTYWIHGRTGSSWLRYVHGERLVRLHTPESGLQDIEVYDFGALRGPPSWYPREDADVSMIYSSAFMQPVVGRLPCRIVRKQGNFPYSGFMIDEERLIGLKRDLSGESLDVFTL